MALTRWQATRPAAATDPEVPTLLNGLKRGIGCRCPVCGKGAIFNGYLKVVPNCVACQAPLGQLRADDAPPYFTMVIVGHIIIPLLLFVDRAYDPTTLTLSLIFLPATLLLTLLLLRPVKGATVGVMASVGMLKHDVVV